MADVNAAREKIAKAAGLLVNRFGHEAPVFELLDGALKDLADPPVRREPKLAVAEPEAETAISAVEPEQVSPEAEVEAQETAAPKVRRGRKSK